MPMWNSDKIVGFVVRNSKCNSDEAELIKYGLSLIYKYLGFISTIMILGIIFGLIFESLIFLVTFSFIRTYAGGFHCKSPVTCYFFSSGIVALVLVVVRFTPIELMQISSMVLLLLSVLAILWLAPIATPNKPLDEVEKKYYRKKALKHLAIELVLVVILFSVNLERFAFTVCLGIAVTGMVVLMQKISEQNRKKENNK